MMSDVNVLVIGCSGRIQNELVLSYVNKVPPGEFIPTVLQTKPVNIIIEGKEYSLNIHTAAPLQDLEDNTLDKDRAALYSKAQAIIFIYHIQQPDTIRHSPWIQQLHKQQLVQTPKLLVGIGKEYRDQGHKDNAELQMDEKKEELKTSIEKDDGIVSSEELNDFIKKIGALGYIEASVKNLANVPEVFEMATKIALGLIKEEEIEKVGCLDVIKKAFESHPAVVNFIEARSPVEQYGHTQNITSIFCYAEFLFSSSLDGTVKVWKIDSGILLRTLQHRSSVHHVCNVGELVASVDDSAVYLWNLTKPQPIFLAEFQEAFKPGSVSRVHFPSKRKIHIEENDSLGIELDSHDRLCNPNFIILSNESSPHVFRFFIPSSSQPPTYQQIPDNFSFLSPKIQQGIQTVTMTKSFYIQTTSSNAQYQDLCIVTVVYNNGDILSFNALNGDVLQFFPGTDRKPRWVPLNQPWLMREKLTQKDLEKRRMRLSKNTGKLEQSILKSPNVKDFDLLAAANVNFIAVERKGREGNFRISRAKKTSMDMGGKRSSSGDEERRSTGEDEGGKRPSFFGGRSSVEGKEELKGNDSHVAGRKSGGSGQQPSVGNSGDARFLMLFRCDGMTITIFNFSTGEILKIIQNLDKGFPSPLGLMRIIHDSSVAHIFVTSKENGKNVVLHFVEPFTEIRRRERLKSGAKSLQQKNAISCEGLRIFPCMDDTPNQKNAGNAFLLPRVYSMPFSIDMLELTFLSKKHEDSEEEIILLGSNFFGKSFVRFTSTSGKKDEMNSSVADINNSKLLLGDSLNGHSIGNQSLYIFSIFPSSKGIRFASVNGHQMFAVPQDIGSVSVKNILEPGVESSRVSSFNLVLRKEKAEFHSIGWIDSFSEWFQILKDHSEMLSLTFDSSFNWPSNYFSFFVKGLSLNMNLYLSQYILFMYWGLMFLLTLFNLGFVLLGSASLNKRRPNLVSFLRIYIPFMANMALFSSVSIAVQIFQCRYDSTSRMITHEQQQLFNTPYCFQDWHILYTTTTFVSVIPFLILSLRVRCVDGLSGISKDHWLSMNWKYDEKKLSTGSFWLSTPTATYETFYLIVRVSLLVLTNLFNSFVYTRLLSLAGSVLCLLTFCYFHPAFSRPLANSFNMALFAFLLFTNGVTYFIYTTSEEQTRIQYLEWYLLSIIPVIMLFTIMFRLIHHCSCLERCRKGVKGALTSYDSSIAWADFRSKRWSHLCKRSFQAKNILFMDTQQTQICVLIPSEELDSPATAQGEEDRNSPRNSNQTLSEVTLAKVPDYARNKSVISRELSDNVNQQIKIVHREEITSVNDEKVLTKSARDNAQPESKFKALFEKITVVGATRVHEVSKSVDMGWSEATAGKVSDHARNKSVVSKESKDFEDNVNQQIEIVHREEITPGNDHKASMKSDRNNAQPESKFKTPIEKIKVVGATRVHEVSKLVDLGRSEPTVGKVSDHARNKSVVSKESKELGTNFNQRVEIINKKDTLPGNDDKVSTKSSDDKPQKESSFKAPIEMKVKVSGVSRVHEVSRSADLGHSKPSFGLKADLSTTISYKPTAVDVTAQSSGKKFLGISAPANVSSGPDDISSLISKFSKPSDGPDEKSTNPRPRSASIHENKLDSLMEEKQAVDVSQKNDAFQTASKSGLQSSSTTSTRVTAPAIAELRKPSSPTNS